MSEPGSTITISSISRLKFFSMIAIPLFQLNLLKFLAKSWNQQKKTNSMSRIINSKRKKVDFLEVRIQRNDRIESMSSLIESVNKSIVYYICMAPSHIYSIYNIMNMPIDQSLQTICYLLFVMMKKYSVSMHIPATNTRMWM